ncbi:MAG: acylphosphatase [Methanothrix sp.]
MERFVISVSGRVQKVGYRSKVIALARDMRITGWVGNLPDGRVEVVAEADAAALDRFVSALKVKNALIDVSDIEVERQDATGEFKAFSKLVDEGETDARLDRSAELLKELIDVTRFGFSDLGQKMDKMLDKQDETIMAIKGIDSKMDRMLDKQDQMLDKQDIMIDKQDQMLDKQDETTGEVRGLRSDMKGNIDMRLERIETALKEKGII